MFGKKFVGDLISRSAENEKDRRVFLKAAGVTGLGVVGAAALGSSGVASAATTKVSNARTASAVAPAAVTETAASAPSDGAVLNFALNLEYLEAEFYSMAATGKTLPGSMVNGLHTPGPVVGGHAVPFKSSALKAIANEIYQDEKDHVAFLRTALGGSKVARPKIDLQASFTAAAMAAGLISAGQTFDPFESDANFLLGAFLFEDVGVTAYKGAAPLITNKTYLGAAAGILAVEAYHAGIIRSTIYGTSAALTEAAHSIGVARDSLDGGSQKEFGPRSTGAPHLLPTDKNGIAFDRNPGQVLNIVYLTPKKATKGGFFPNGVNGVVNTSQAN